jgi:hypothetical protein
LSSHLQPLAPGEIEESIIDTIDDNPALTLGDLQQLEKHGPIREPFQRLKTLARDSCGEGKSAFFRTSSGAIWKKFPVFIYIDESKYPGTEEKTHVRSAIISVFRDVNEILGFSFFSVRLDPTICPIKISFEYLDTGGIGHTSWRYNRDKEMTQATIRLHTGTRWFINPYEQCYQSGRHLHFPGTMAHELGHAIGIAHNNEDNRATMRPYGQAGETLRATFGLSERTFMHQCYDQFKPR